MDNTPVTQLPFSFFFNNFFLFPGPLSNANMDQISEDLNSNWSDRHKTDQNLQSSMKSRAELPIFAMKNDIMAAIHENPVVLIRGNTGCGKNTNAKTLISPEIEIKIREIEISLFFVLIRI